VLLTRLVGRKGDLLQPAPLLPRDLAAPALVELVCSTREAHTGGLHTTVRKSPLGEEAAPSALLARVDVAAAARKDLALAILHREHAAGAMDAGLGRVQLWCVPGSILKPLDLAYGNGRGRHFACG